MTPPNAPLPPPGPSGRLLWPVAALRARRWRCADTPRSGFAVPVVACTGATGVGSGVTPALVSLATDLASRGLAVQCVAPGAAAVRRVDPRRDRIADVGRAALHLSAFAPAWAAPEAEAGIRAAVDAGADAVLVEDGFGPPRTGRGPPCDLLLAVVRLGGPQPLGNGRLWPAGPLALPAACLSAPGTVLLAHGPEAARSAFRAAWLPRLPGAVVLSAEMRPLAMGMTWAGRRLFAFSAMARPERLFDTLRGLGATVARAVALPHRQPIGARLLSRLDLEARLSGAQLVTTDEDALSLPQSVRPRVLTLPMRMEGADWGPLADRIAALRG